jgi:hypothetical protein
MLNKIENFDNIEKEQEEQSLWIAITNAQN